MGAGLLAGSFVATLVVRWPQGRSIAAGRSRCDGCDRALVAAELVPLLAWAVLRGRCRTCGAPIDPRHPRIELAAGAIGLAALAAAPGLGGWLGALFGWLLLALAALDWERRWLPDRLTLPLAAIGIAAGLLVAPPLADRVIGLAAGYGGIALLAAGYRAVRGRHGIGGGDPKLFGAIGAWLGWRALPPVLLIAAGVGLAIVLARRLRGLPVRADDELPLGTLLAAAAFLMWLAARATPP